MMTKEVAKQVIDGLPDEATFDDIMYALYIRSKFARGEAQIREGLGVPHDGAKLRLRKE